MTPARRRLAGGLAIATGAMASSTFGTLGFAAIAPLVRDRFALRTVEVGGLTALVFLGALVCSVPAGRLTDRLGAPRMLAAALAGVAGGVAISALAPSRLVFFAGILVAGCAYGGINPPTNVLASDLVPRGHRALLLSLKQSGVPLGGLVAGSVLPGLAATVGWRAALVAPIAVLLATALVALRLTPEARPAAPSADAAAPGASPQDAAGPAPALGPTWAYGFLMAGIQLAFVGYLTVYLVDHHGFSPTRAGFALSVALLGGVVGRPLWGAFSDGRRSHATSLALAGAGSAAGLGLLAIDGDGATLWAALLVVGFCSMGWNGVYLALVADGTRAGRLGRATGSALVYLYAGVVLLPPLFGLVVDALGSWPGSWLVAAAGALAATAAMALPPRRLPVLPAAQAGPG